MDLILGSEGNLGKALVEKLQPKDFQVLNKRDIQDWASPTIPVVMNNFFEKSKYSYESVFVCAGIIDQSRHSNELMAVNCFLPRNLLQLSVKYGYKVITFGSVHENSLIENPYINSKRAYLNILKDSHAEGNFLHFQLNTLFGGFQNRSSTFLGQLESAIRQKSIFRMSSGIQLREFHNIGLAASSTLDAIIDSLDQKGTHPIFHGNSLSLAEVATVALEAFGLLNNLRLGALADPANEVLESDFFSPKKAIWIDSFGHGLKDIIEYLKLRM